MNKMTTVFVVLEDEGDEASADEVGVLGVYATRAGAVAAIKAQATDPKNDPTMKKIEQDGPDDWSQSDRRGHMWAGWRIVETELEAQS